MAKPFTFHEFETLAGTVYKATQTTDDMMAVVDTPSIRTAVGSSGVILGTLQSLGGQRQQDLSARIGSVVNYVFMVDNSTVNFSQISNGDALVINGRSFDILHVEDETGVNLAPVIYMSRTT